MMNGGAISWKSGLKDSVDSSTPEAEYMVASLCRPEMVYIRAILRDFGFLKSQPTLVYKDNLACISMSILGNPVMSINPLASHRYSKTLPSRPVLERYS